MRVVDVSLDVCQQLIVVLTTDDDSVALAFEHLGIAASFARSERSSQPLVSRTLRRPF
jgi:hypothetical protein